MQALIVRPVMTGLLALIIAGFWGTPLGIRGGGAFIYQSGCHGAAPASQSPAVAGAMIRRGVRCRGAASDPIFATASAEGAA